MTPVPLIVSLSQNKPNSMPSDHQVNERCMYCEGQMRPLVKKVSSQKPEVI